MGQLDDQSRTRRMKTSRMCIYGAALVTIVVSNPIVAIAHSFPEKETPSAGQKVASPPSEVVIGFDAPIEKLFAKLEVAGADGTNEAVGAPQISDDGRQLSVKVDALKPGDYTVKWAVVGIDTHHTEGSYTFSVANGGS
jgi:methionine-rich copper-binding protein CopC